MDSKKIEIAKWLLDPDKNQVLPDDLSFLGSRLKELGLLKIYQEIELPLIEILDDMQMSGIKVDVKILEKLSGDLSRQLDLISRSVFKNVDLAGSGFNLNSPKQLSEILFQKLKIDTRGIPRRKTGFYSTDAETLLKIKDRHPIIPLLLEYRELFKIKSTYAEPLLFLMAKDGRVHTTFLQTGTATGRLSSQNPNLQNIPIFSEWGKKLRRAFVAEKGFSLASFDYSQIELRILASVAEDRKMIEAFEKDMDIHVLTAANVYNVDISKVTSEMRRFAKTLNFGIIYGMGPEAFARASGLSREEAEIFISEYFNDFHSIKSWQQKIIEEARKSGYVENLNGRKRFLPNLNSPNRRLSAAAERMAINMPIQGLAADVIKIAMFKVTELLKNNNWRPKQARLLLSIHDELIFEIRDDILKQATSLIKKEMESAYALKVSLKVDFAYGKNWSEL